VYGIDAKGVVISAGLDEFVIQCITDAGDIEREMRYLGRNFQGLWHMLIDLHLTNAQV